MSDKFEQWKQEYRNINNCGLSEIFDPNEWVWDWIKLAFDAGASAARKEAFEECRQIAADYEEMDGNKLMEKYGTYDTSEAIQLASKEGQN